MPYKLVPKIQEDTVEPFLEGWEDNRVRGLIFEPRQTVRLRYLVTAYHFRHRVAFGYINFIVCNHSILKFRYRFVDSENVREKYQIPRDMDTVLLFNENTSTPMASLSMKDIPTYTLHHIVSSNQYLALPRLSSQVLT